MKEGQGKRCIEKGARKEVQGKRCKERGVRPEVSIQRFQDRGVRTGVRTDSVRQSVKSQDTTHGQEHLGEREVDPLPYPGLLPQLPPEATYL